MPTHSDTHASPYSREQLFALVADVERYPEFLPWCRAARITERGEGYFIADLVIRFSHVTEKYTSRVELIPPERITATMVKGPFHHLYNEWTFSPRQDGTTIDFSLDFTFKNKLLDKLIGGMFTRATEKMSAAFMTRADALYGKTPY